MGDSTLLTQLEALHVLNDVEPSDIRPCVAREVTLSVGQTLEQQEALEKLLREFFEGKRCSVTVRFHSGTNITLSVTLPKDWTSEMNVDALINEAISKTWTVNAAVVRVVTFSINLNESQEEELEKFITTISKKMQFSVHDVTFNSGTKMTLRIKPLSDGPPFLDVDSYIIQVLTAAQYPLRQGVHFLPKGQTWNLSAVRGEVEEVLSFSSCSSAGPWDMFGLQPIDYLVDFAIELNQQEQEDLQKYFLYTVSTTTEYAVTAKFDISPMKMWLSIAPPKDQSDKGSDVVTVINEALTEARCRGHLGKNLDKTWTTRPLAVRVISAFADWNLSMIYWHVTNNITPYFTKRRLFVTWTAIQIDPNYVNPFIRIFIAPLKDVRPFHVNVNGVINEVFTEMIKEHNWSLKWVVS